MLLVITPVARYLLSMNDLTPDGQNKFARYRARKRAKGLREVRMWVPDVNAPGFWERSVLAAAILRNAPEEEETMCFIEAMQAEDSEFWD